MSTISRKFRFVASVLAILMVVFTITGCDSNVANHPSGGSGDVSELDFSSIFNSGSKDETSKDISVDISEEPQDTVVSFLACPDNIIHPSVFYDAIRRAAEKNGTDPIYTDLHNREYDFTQIYDNVVDFITSADISYMNQETLIGGTGKKISGYPQFNSPQAIADTVIDMGVDVVNVAHNHMLDSGDTMFLDNCNDVFESQGVEVIGYYPDNASTEKITVIESKGIKVAFLAYTYSTNGIPLPPGSSHVIPYFNESLVTKQVELAKEVADVVIASCHWGAENSFNIDSQQKQYSKLMCDLGVDVVLGMHPHVVQPMQWMTSDNGNKTLVVYSLGNFVSGMVNGKNMLAGMLSLDIVKDAQTGEISIESPLFIPTVTHYEAESKVASNDTGYREFKIYLLSDYTEELASRHGVVNYERSHSSTLVGGKFSISTLRQTLTKYIPSEFLPEDYR